MLSLKDISKSFNNKIALKNVSVSLKFGKVSGLLGPNGAGKTTFMRIIAGLLKPDSGYIQFKSNSVSKLEKLNIGYLPEERGLYKNATGYENIKYICSLKGLSSNSIKKAINQYSEYFDSKQILNELVGKLSKGNQQKIQLISLFAQNPDIILLDEPYTGLDPFAQEQLNNIIFDCAKLDKIVIISTHLLEKAEKFCNDVHLLNKGNILYSGDIGKLQKEYQLSSYEIPNDKHVVELLAQYNINHSVATNKIIITETNTDLINELLKSMLKSNTLTEFKRSGNDLQSIFMALTKRNTVE